MKKAIECTMNCDNATTHNNNVRRRVTTPRAAAAAAAVLTTVYKHLTTKQHSEHC